MNKIKKAIFLSSPFLISVIALIVGILPFQWFPAAIFHIPIVFGIIYYFTIFKPAALNVLAVFILGLFADLIMHTPLGIQPLLFMSLLFATALNRRFLAAQQFDGQWVGFMMIFLLIMLLRYIVSGLLMAKVPDVSFFFWEYVFVALCYPPTALLCGYLSKKIGEVA